MTPAARISAAIDVLDLVVAGEAAEKALTGWGRRNRYAGSGDRAAVRDLVFAALRCRRSFGYLGGGDTGRQLMIGWASATHKDPDQLFTGEKYAAAVLTEEEAARRDLAAAIRGEQLDCPDWLLPKFDASCGDRADDVLRCLQQRAPVFLRVNQKRTSLAEARDILAQTGIETRPSLRSPSGLEVTENPRRVAQSVAYQDGLVELQDAGSQAVVDVLPLRESKTVLDYCAGGGGKSLAIAAKSDASVTAWDADADRMNDLSVRAKRSGASIEIAASEDIGQSAYDLVLCDVPCSGSGSWRRAPAAKWSLTDARLAELIQMQRDILVSARGHCTSNGCLAYVTCSVFLEENEKQIQWFTDQFPEWIVAESQQSLPDEHGDGFFMTLLKRA